MARLKRRYVDLPEGWRFLVAETGHVVDASTFFNLVNEVFYHMTINDLEIPDHLDKVIEDQLCITAPAHMVTQG